MTDHADHTDHTGHPAPFPHPAYERLAATGPPDPHSQQGYYRQPGQHIQPDQASQQIQPGQPSQTGQSGRPGRRHATRPAPRRDGSPAGLPRRGDTCPNCDATRACCQCRADVGDLRRFARRMAELHQHTGTPVCGCGAHHCYIRRRLDDIGPEVGT